METFFEKTPYALYFVGLLFLVISNKNDKNQEKVDSNIILIYIISLLVNLFNIIDIFHNICIVLIISFIELQIMYLNTDSLVVKSKYKFLDYTFTMINQYKIIYIILINIGIGTVRKWQINANSINLFFYTILIIFFFVVITKVYRNIFRVKSFKKMEIIFENKARGFSYEEIYGTEMYDKLHMLTDVEDKTFFYRQRSHNSLSFEALMNKINRKYEYNEIMNEIDDNSFKEFVFKTSMLIIYGNKILSKIIKAILYKNGVRRFIKRGYSTVEMQWIRNAGIEIGYDLTYRRKIFELIYSNIFFKSLREKRKYNSYPEYSYQEPRELYKHLIVFVYLKTVPTFYYQNEERVRVENIYEFYEIIRKEKISKDKRSRILEELTKEELFIFIMGLSGKYIWDGLYRVYSNYIDYYDIDINKVNTILKDINYF